MKIVLDTNVLVAGLLTPTGPPGWIIEAALAGDLDLVFNMAICLEYNEVLHRKELDLPAAHVGEVLAAIDKFGFEAVAIGPWPLPLPDPDDAMFLAVAAATRCPLVTGNLRHFPARSHGRVEVVSPRQFADRFLKDSAR